MKTLLIAVATIALVAVPSAGKNMCRDAKGHFAKASECAGKAAPAAASDETPTAANTKKDKTGRCRWTTTTKQHKAGQFAKCP